jgi:hypothetical protein
MTTCHETYRERRTKLIDDLDDAIAWGLCDLEYDLNEQINDLDDQYCYENNNV